MISAHRLDISGCSPAAEISCCAIRRRVTAGDIAGAARPHVIGNWLPTRLLEGLDDLQHTIAPSRSQIESEASRLFERLQRGYVPLGQIHDVDVVPHTRSVRGIVIIASDVQALASADRNLGHEW